LVLSLFATISSYWGLTCIRISSTVEVTPRGQMLSSVCITPF
jgi:hypothetical protein